MKTKLFNILILGLIVTGMSARILYGNKAVSMEYQVSILKSQANKLNDGSNNTANDAFDISSLMTISKKSGLVENTNPYVLYIDSGVAFDNQSRTQ